MIVFSLIELNSIIQVFRAIFPYLGGLRACWRLRTYTIDWSGRGARAGSVALAANMQY
jgi:hypothetical protein